MTLIVCVDDRMGLSFNNRRLSSDKAVIEDILACAGKDRIFINRYSLPLFKGVEDRVCVRDSLFNYKDAVYFAENGTFTEIANDVNKLFVYKWNRCYPSDCKFPLSIFSTAMMQKSVVEFEGSSHACITREEFVR